MPQNSILIEREAKYTGIFYTKIAYLTKKKVVGLNLLGVG